MVTKEQINKLKENWAETDVTDYSKGYTNGYHKACDDVIKLLWRGENHA